MGQNSSKGKRKKVNSEIAVISAKSKNAVPDTTSMVLKLNQTLQGRLDRLDAQVVLFEKRINEICAKEEDLERRADEAMTTFGNNVQLIMLFHGFVSMFLQARYPRAGVWVSVSMVVSFFSAFMVSFIVNFNKIEGMFQSAKDLQRNQTDLKEEVISFGAKIESMRYYDPEFRTLTSMGADRGVSNRMDLLNRHVATLKKSRHETVELSNSKRKDSLFKIAIVAIIYGLTFPMIAYFFLYYVFGFGRMGLVRM